MPDGTDVLRRLEESLWRSETRYDPHYMERVFAPDFFEFGRSGRRYTRQECLEIDPGREIRAKFPLEAFSISMIDDRNALVTYVSEVMYATLERANRASLWSRSGEGWHLRFHQGTPTI